MDVLQHVGLIQFSCSHLLLILGSLSLLFLTHMTYTTKNVVERNHFSMLMSAGFAAIYRKDIDLGFPDMARNAAQAGHYFILAFSKVLI